MAKDPQRKGAQHPIAYSFAAPADKDRIRRLLDACELPTLYVGKHLDSFIVAKAARKTVGVIGIEVYGREALLRSLCVDQAYRGLGIAMMLNAMILSYTRRLKIDRLYLFTWYAEKFASKLGFRRIDKKRIPKSLRSSWQFRKLNRYHYPFICMMKRIRRQVGH